MDQEQPDVEEMEEPKEITEKAPGAIHGNDAHHAHPNSICFQLSEEKRLEFLAWLKEQRMDEIAMERWAGSGFRASYQEDR